MFEDLFTIKFLVLAVLCFLGSFIDSIAGGGGLITLPAYMASVKDHHIWHWELIRCQDCSQV